MGLNREMRTHFCGAGAPPVFHCLEKQNHENPFFQCQSNRGAVVGNKEKCVEQNQVVLKELQELAKSEVGARLPPNQSRQIRRMTHASCTPFPFPHAYMRAWNVGRACDFRKHSGNHTGLKSAPQGGEATD